MAVDAGTVLAATLLRLAVDLDDQAEKYESDIQSLLLAA